MKYSQTMSVPTEIFDWLEKRLEAYGIEAGVYSHYMISLLNSDPTDLALEDDDCYETNSKKKSRRPTSSRKRLLSTDNQRCNKEDGEKLKRAFAVQSLMTASNQFQPNGLDSLIDELYEKLQKWNSDASNNPEFYSNEQLSLNSNSQIKKQEQQQQKISSLEEKVNQYYAAFPPLDSKASHDEKFKFLKIAMQWGNKHKPYYRILENKLDQNNIGIENNNIENSYSNAAIGSNKNYSAASTSNEKNITWGNNVIENTNETELVGAASINHIMNEEKHLPLSQSTIANEQVITNDNNYFINSYDRRMNDDLPINFNRLFENNSLPSERITFSSQPNNRMRQPPLITPQQIENFTLYLTDTERLRENDNRNLNRDVLFASNTFQNSYRSRRNADVNELAWRMDPRNPITQQIIQRFIYPRNGNNVNNERRRFLNMFAGLPFVQDRRRVLNAEYYENFLLNNDYTYGKYRKRMNRYERNNVGSDDDDTYDDDDDDDYENRYVYRNWNPNRNTSENVRDAFPFQRPQELTIEERKNLTWENSFFNDKWSNKCLCDCKESHNSQLKPEQNLLKSNQSQECTSLFQTPHNSNISNRLTMSFLKLNHNKDSSPFNEVIPQQKLINLNTYESTKNNSIPSATLKTADDFDEKEDLLNSTNSHFKPIKESTNNSNEGCYADGATFNISNNLERINYKRSESGALYLDNDYGIRKKYCEYKLNISYNNTNTTNNLTEHLVESSSTSSLSSFSSSASSSTLSTSDMDFVLKYTVCQNDKACQTDNEDDDDNNVEPKKIEKEKIIKNDSDDEMNECAAATAASVIGELIKDNFNDNDISFYDDYKYVKKNDKKTYDTNCNCGWNTASSNNKTNLMSLDDNNRFSLHTVPSENSLVEVTWKQYNEYGTCEKCANNNKFYNTHNNEISNSFKWTTNNLNGLEMKSSTWNNNTEHLRNIWNGEKDICLGCSRKNACNPLPTEQQIQLREDIIQDGDQLLSDLSTLQKSYLMIDDYTVPQLTESNLAITAKTTTTTLTETNDMNNYCNGDLSEILVSKERKRRHSPVIDYCKDNHTNTVDNDNTETQTSSAVDNNCWSFTSRLEEDCLIQMSTLPTLRSVTF